MKSKIYASVLVVLSIAMLVSVASLNANALPIGCQIPLVFQSQDADSPMTPDIAAQKQCELEIGDLRLIVFKTASNDYLRIVFQGEKSSATLEVFSNPMVDGRIYNEFHLDGIFLYGVKSENNLIAPLNNQPKAAQVASQMKYGNKWWDDIYFSIPNGVKYYHPNKAYYSIQPWHDRLLIGKDLYHQTFDTVQSDLLATLGPIALGAFIGGLIGFYAGGPVGAGILALLGALIGALLGGVTKDICLDEDNNIWIWTSIHYSNWLIANAAYLILLFVLNPQACQNHLWSGFYTLGYVQVGSACFWDGVYLSKGPVGWY